MTYTTPEGYTAVCAWCKPMRWIDSNGNRARELTPTEAKSPDISHGCCGECVEDEYEKLADRYPHLHLTRRATK